MDNFEGRESSDGKILFTFKVSLALIFGFSIFNLLIRGRPGFITSLNVFFNGLTLCFFITGLISWYHYGKKHIIGYRKFFIYVLILIVVISVILLSVLFLQYRGLEIEILDFRIAFRIRTFILGILSSIFGFILVYFLFLVMGFGVIGVLSALLRKYTAQILNNIKDITENISRETKDEDILTYLKGKVLAWTFAVPPYIDTISLKIKRPEREIKFPKNKFKSAIIWQVFFCIILAINISLNPILLEYFSLSELFSITSSLAVFIPIIVLPWFIYLKLDAKIEAPARNFHLYEGLKNRVLSMLVATGTLITFVRLSVGRIDFRIFIISLLGYLSGILILTILYSFVYFNHFWEDLVKDVHRRFEEENR